MYLPSADRRRVLLERVQETVHLNTRGLAEEFSVDGSTIRRDLAHLERSGLIVRTRGGFLSAEPRHAVDLPYDVRRKQNQATKAALGVAAAELVSDHQTIVVDSGSTMYHFASALRRRRHLTVMTNDLLVASRIATQPTNTVHVTGGYVLDTVYTLVGDAAVGSFSGWHFDWAFIGAEAVDTDHGVTNINVPEVPVKQAMIEATDHVVLITDSSKLGQRALVPVCPLSEVTVLLTDDALPESERGRYGPALRCVDTSATEPDQPTTQSM